MKDKNYYVYILTNSRHTVLYVGVTNDLVRRIYEHKAKLSEGFTKKYNVNELVYFDFCNDVEEAILKEKKIKGGSRAGKIKLIKTMNPEWKDLYNSLC